MELIMDYTMLDIPTWVWAVLTILYMGVLYIGIPLLAIYGAYVLIMSYFGISPVIGNLIGW